mmetsp:Transcript_127050/g.244825  ORF Transcript_127050/g.244825 Transcript_127050/m.244825 type:complete len:299 (+) Transcript_127050:66-962(+)
METAGEISSMAALLEGKLQQLKRDADELEAGAQAKRQKILDDAEADRKRIMDEAQEERDRAKALLKTLPRVCEQMQGYAKLNIGGFVFETSTDTLSKSHWFATLLSGKFALKLDPNGAVFIDRDGRHFDVILNYLRMGKRALRGLELKQGPRLQLIEEAEFYQLQELSGLLASPAVGQKANVRLPGKKLIELNITEELEHECGKLHAPGKCNCLYSKQGPHPHKRHCRCRDGGHVPLNLIIEDYSHNAGQPVWTVSLRGHSIELDQTCVHSHKDTDIAKAIESMVEKIVDSKMSERGC